MNEYLLQAQWRYQETGLVWGVFDCCTFAFDWVRLLTGVDPMADYRGRYASREEAIRLFWENGDLTLDGALARLLGEAVAPALSQRGDVAYRAEEKAVGIMIAQGARQRGLFLGDSGLAALEMNAVTCAFRI